MLECILYTFSWQLDVRAVSSEPLHVKCIDTNSSSLEPPVEGDDDTQGLGFMSSISSRSLLMWKARPVPLDVQPLSDAVLILAT